MGNELKQAQYLSNYGFNKCKVRVVAKGYGATHRILSGEHTSITVLSEARAFGILARCMRLKELEKLAFTSYRHNYYGSVAKRCVMYQSPNTKHIKPYSDKDELIYTWKNWRYYLSVKEESMEFNKGDWVVVKSAYWDNMSSYGKASFGNNMLWQVTSFNKSTGSLVLVKPDGDVNHPSMGSVWNLGVDDVVKVGEPGNKQVDNLLAKVNPKWTGQNEPNGIYYGDYHQVVSIEVKDGNPVATVIDFTGTQVEIPAKECEFSLASQVQKPEPEKESKPVIKSVSSAPKPVLPGQKPVPQPPGDRLQPMVKYLHVQVQGKKLPFAEARDYGCAFNIPVLGDSGFFSLSGSGNPYLPAKVIYDEKDGTGFVVVPFKLGTKEVPEGPESPAAHMASFSELVEDSFYDDHDDDDDDDGLGIFDDEQESDDEEQHLEGAP